MPEVTRDVTIVEMLQAMSRYSDDDVFRWFVVSRINADGEPEHVETLRLTVGQARKDLGL